MTPGRLHRSHTTLSPSRWARHLGTGNPRLDPIEPLNMSADPAPKDAVLGRLARLSQPKPEPRNIIERQHAGGLPKGER